MVGAIVDLGNAWLVSGVSIAVLGYSWLKLRGYSVF